MADLTNYPEMTDELLQKFIGQALQQAMKPQDTGSPLTSGLLAAGLGMMAGSRGRNFGEALGQGGLLGLQAYGAQKEAQKKDPMQMISLLTAVQGLRTNQEKQQWLKDFPGGMGAPAQYAPQSDFAPGEAPGPVTPPMTPQMTAPPVSGQAIPMPKLMRGMALDIPLAKTLYEGYGKAPSKLGPGDIPQNFNPLTGQWEQGQQIPYLDKGMRMTPQGVQPEPGYPQAAADIAGATTAAQEKERARYTPVQTTQGGVPVTTTAAALAAAQNAAQGGLPPDIATLYADYVKSGGPERGEPFKLNYIPKPQQRLGVGLSKADEAAAVKAAEAPITLSTEYEKGLQTQNLGFRKKVIEQADIAQQQKDMTRRFMQLNQDPDVASGGAAELISSLKNYADSAGIPIKGLSAEQAMQSVSNQMMLNIRNPDSGGGLPGATSDRDLGFLAKIPVTLTQSKEGRAFVAETNDAINDRKLQLQQKMLQHEINGGKFDPAFQKSIADWARENPLFGEKEQKRLEQLTAAQADPPGAQQNMTATARAKAALKDKADRAAVLQRMREQGYSTKGL